MSRAHDDSALPRETRESRLFIETRYCCVRSTFVLFAWARAGYVIVKLLRYVRLLTATHQFLYRSSNSRRFFTASSYSQSLPFCPSSCCLCALLPSPLLHRSSLFVLSTFLRFTTDYHVPLKFGLVCVARLFSSRRIAPSSTRPSCHSFLCLFCSFHPILSLVLFSLRKIAQANKREFFCPTRFIFIANLIFLLFSRLMFDKKQVSVLRYRIGIVRYYKLFWTKRVIYSSRKKKNDNNKCRVFNFIYVHPRLKIAIISLITYSADAFYSQITEYNFFFFFWKNEAIQEKKKQ